MRKMKVCLDAGRTCFRLWLVGCDKNNSTEPVTNDKDAMSSLVANDALFQTDAVLLNDGDPTSDGNVIEFSWKSQHGNHSTQLGKKN